MVSCDRCLENGVTGKVKTTLVIEKDEGSNGKNRKAPRKVPMVNPRPYIG